MTKKEKILVFTNIITAILLVVLGGVLLLSNNKDENKKDDTTNCVSTDENNTNENEDTNDKDNEDKDSENKDDVVEVVGSLIYSDYSEEIKIYLKNDKTLELVSKNLGNKVIAENVSKTYDIHAGQSDVCEGNRWIVAETEDNKYTAISIDALSCGEKVEILNVSEKLAKMNLNDTISIYETKAFTNQYEPISYNVFAINEDGKSTDITSIFE